MKRAIFTIFLIALSTQLQAQPQGMEKMNGVNFVSPKNKSKLAGIDSIKAIHANWVALCPWALLENKSSTIIFNTTKNWWGDTRIGLIEEVKRARLNKLKVFIKPHFWVINSGWVGDFNVSGKVKTAWENNYKAYLLYLAKLSDSLNVEMLCIGTELKTYTANHPDFFIGLIDEIRRVYKGKLTYAANWDEYEHVSFWHKLDYISIDAYFPLSVKKTPEVAELEGAWKKLAAQLKVLSVKLNKKILFTEYGYRSIDYTASKQWEFEHVPKTDQINLSAQVNAYAAFYNTIWKEQYIAGGFLWKWYDQDDGRKNNSDYTPQSKPALRVIKEHYTLKQ